MDISGMDNTKLVKTARDIGGAPKDEHGFQGKYGETAENEREEGSVVTEQKPVRREIQEDDRLHKLLPHKLLPYVCGFRLARSFLSKKAL